MPDFVYVFDGKEKVVVTSMRQLSKLTGIPYRTIQRKMDFEIYCDPLGRFRIWKSYFEKDERRNNRNPNL